MELTAAFGRVAAVSARVDMLSGRAGQASGFVDALNRARATVEGDGSPVVASQPLPGDERHPSVVSSLSGERTVTLGQALSLWGGASPGAAPGGPAGSFSYPLSAEAGWVEGLPPAGRRIAGAIDAAARAEGVDPRLLASLVWAESGFHQESVSRAGATGLAQLMPATAAGLGVDASDPLENLRGGARYLRIQLDRFGRADLALAAYNAGPGRVRQAGGNPDIPETQGYVRNVLGRFRDLGGLV